MSCRMPKLFLLLLIASVFVHGIIGLGWMYPPIPIYRLVNESYDIFCTFNVSEKNSNISSHLWFYVADIPEPAERVEIINGTTIKLHVDNAPVNKTVSVCKLNNEKGVAMKDVFVGYKPTKVINFKCRSYNWQHMICSFEQIYNPIPTKYELEYRLTTNLYQKYQCPITNNYNNSFECFIGLNTTYRQSHETYMFVLNSTNVFGTLLEDFKINNFDNVIPDPPINISAYNITSRSTTLVWNISYKLKTFQRNFTHQVNITNRYDKTWKEISIQNLIKNGTTYTLHLNNLEYANAEYDVRIRLRTEPITEHKDIEEMWSKFQSCIFSTLPRIPDNPPEVAIGGYEVNDYNDILIYWKEFPESKSNGKEMHYKVTKVLKNNQSLIHVKADVTTTTMAQFKNMSSSSYEFTIHSANELGDSIEGSVLKIPSREERLQKPEISKLLSDKGVYELFWEAKDERITSYTVFWCESKSNSPNDCESSINFVYVNASTKQYKLIYRNNTVNFAVSANSDKSSSGMAWASCTVTQKSDIGKLKTIWIPTMQSTYMDLEWKLECGDKAIVAGYNLIYCPIRSPKTLECKEHEKNIKLDNTGLTTFRITDLKPYITYKIQIAMFSNDRQGPRSEPLVNTTLEAAPSPPRQLVARDVRNDSMMLYWKPPEDINGGKMYYEIWYNNQSVRLNHNNETEIEYKLSNLSAFRKYKILVLAYTVNYSEPSNSVFEYTKIGTPSAMQQPSSKDMNNSKIQITWSRPEKPAGNIEYYELQTITKKNDIITNAKIMRLRGCSCRLKYSICKNDTDKYEFSVRAVNVVLSPHANRSMLEKDDDDNDHHYVTKVSSFKSNDNELNYDIDDVIECEAEYNKTYKLIDWYKVDHYAEHLKGEWSKPLAHWCNYSVNNVALILFVFLCTLFLTAIVVCIFCMFNKIKQVQSIKVSLPEGLIDIVSVTKPEMLHDNYMKKPDILNEALEKKYPHEQEESLLNNGSDPGSQSSNNSVENGSQYDSHEFADSSGHSTDDAQHYDETASLNSSNDFDKVESFPVDSNIVANSNVSEKKIVPSQPLSTSPSNFTKMPNNYMKAPLIKPNTGYVQHPISKPSTGGYTQLTDFCKPIISTNSDESDINSFKLNVKTPIVASTDAEGISGYVTHKQLSDFGHRMQ